MCEKYDARTSHKNSRNTRRVCQAKQKVSKSEFEKVEELKSSEYLTVCNIVNDCECLVIRPKCNFKVVTETGNSIVNIQVGLGRTPGILVNTFLIIVVLGSSETGCWRVGRSCSFSSWRRCYCSLLMKQSKKKLNLRSLGWMESSKVWVNGVIKSLGVKGVIEPIIDKCSFKSYA